MLSPRFTNLQPLALLSAFAVLLGISISAQGQLSPRDQLGQYLGDLQKNPADDALRGKIIKLALTIEPKPATTPDQLETIGAATYAFKNAKSPDEMKTAAGLYGKALLVEPWRADLYYNQGLAWERAGQLADAIRSLEFYLIASPGANDADETREKIGGFKYAISQKLQAQTQQNQDENQAAEVFSKWRYEGNRQTTLEFVGTDRSGALPKLLFLDLELKHPFYHSALLYESPVSSLGCTEGFKPSLLTLHAPYPAKVLLAYGGSVSLSVNGRDYPCGITWDVCPKMNGRWKVSPDGTKECLQ